MPKAACTLLILFSAALTGCGRGSGGSAAPQDPRPHDPQLIHAPPITQLAAEQLRSLSMECEKYVPENSARGPYDAKYCEDAIAAWSDSPLQIVVIKRGEAVGDSPPSPR
jgi:hypothetical protein